MRRSVRLFALAVTLAACGEVKPTVIDGPTEIDAAVDAPIDGPSPDAPPNAVTLTVVRGGNAVGRVRSNPDGIDCGASCSASYLPGTLVTLTAETPAGVTFTGWGGACSGSLTTCSVQLGATAVAVNANFDVARHAVLATVNGNGRITAAAAGIDCPGTCMASVDHGTTVNFTATAQTGSTFLGWSGACTGTGPCALTINADTQLGAAFGQNQSLIVTKSGTGSGTVAGTGIDCGADCTEIYPANTMVTLTATPRSDSVFAGWSGACSGTAPTCTVTINAATTVDATFNLRQFTLTVMRTGMGTGTITSVSPGINCGTDCTETYNSGTMVTLVANGGADTTFGGWTGDCTNLTGPCTVTMSQARNVTARFDLAPTVLLTLSVYGQGTVIASPAPTMGPMTCASTGTNTTTCQLTYARNTNVTLRTSTSAPYMLIELQNCTPVDATSCTAMMSASRTVSAYFCSSTGACPL